METTRKFAVILKNEDATSASDFPERINLGQLYYYKTRNLPNHLPLLKFMENVSLGIPSCNLYGNVRPGAPFGGFKSGRRDPYSIKVSGGYYEVVSHDENVAEGIVTELESIVKRSLS